MTTPTPDEVRVPDPSAERANSAVRRAQTTQLDPHMHFVVSKPQISIRATTIGHAVLAPPAPVPAEAAPPRVAERKRNAREMDSIAALPVETQPLPLERPKSAYVTTREMTAEERQRALAELGNLSLLPALPQAAVPSASNPPEVLTRSMSMEAMLSAPAEPPFLGESAHVAQLPSAVSAGPARQASAPGRPAPVQQLEVAPTELMDAVGFRPRRRGSRPFLLVTMVLFALGVTGGSLYLKRHPALLQPHAKPVIALAQRGVKLARAGLALAGAAPRRTASRPAPAAADATITQLTPPDEVRAEPATEPEKGAGPKQLTRKNKRGARAKQTIEGEAARAAAAAEPRNARESASAHLPQQAAAAETKANGASARADAPQQAASAETKASGASATAGLAQQAGTTETKDGSEGEPAHPTASGEHAESGAAGAEPGALFASPQVAAELYIAGRYKEALAEYRTLATLNPEVRSYAQFARILRRRLVEICVRTQPHRQAECEQL